MSADQFFWNNQAVTEFTGSDPTDKVHITITNEVMGSSSIRLIGHESFNNSDTPSTLEVKLYKMIVEDSINESRSIYSVTRDSYVATGQDDDRITAKETFVDNYAFEPESKISNYVGIPMEPFPKGTNFGAIALKNMLGNDGLVVDPNRQNGQMAMDITIHVGGRYEKNDGSQRITGSLGCFTLSGDDGGNLGIEEFYKDISDRHANNSYSGILITVYKRDNVDWSFIIDKNGKKVSWNF